MQRYEGCGGVSFQSAGDARRPVVAANKLEQQMLRRTS